MSRQTSLNPQQKSYVAQIIDLIITATPSIRNNDAARLTRVELKRLAAAGELLAETSLDALSEDGTRSMVTNRLDADKSTFEIAGKRRIVIPSHIGTVTMRGNIKHMQQTLWWFAGWQHIEAKRRNDARFRDRMGINVEVWDTVLQLRDLYPGTRNPKEACDLAGIDPRQFKLG